MLLKILNVSQPSTDTRLLARDLKLSHSLSSGGREGSFRKALYGESSSIVPYLPAALNG